MDFSTDKILTISARDYFVMTGKNPRNFISVGVHFNGAEYGAHYPKTDSPLVNLFAREVPKGTEVVVGYSASAGGTVDEPDGFTVYVAQGTALIPRTKESSLATK